MEVVSRRRALFVIFISLFSIWWFGRPLVEVFRRIERIENLQREVEQLSQKREELAGKVEYYKTLGFVEKEARNRLNLAKEGERVVILPQEGEDVLGENTVEVSEEHTPNWLLWKRVFFK